ncbi:MAG: DUF2911 domain-containing protein, partial [Chitinophagaceae bacterium]|nr:DUF2911 domain-containing protein [Chitinophagaceae bacterium]
AQKSNLPAVDKSPMDMAYYPHHYPSLKLQNKVTEPLAARIIYSRPQIKGREIFGTLVKYGEVWRLGANEATEIQFFRNVIINGKMIHKGRYTLYALVNQDNWTMILNRETDIWGAFKYDAAKDVIRVSVPVQHTDEPVEYLSMLFEKAAGGCNLVIAWDKVQVAMPITF